VSKENSEQDGALDLIVFFEQLFLQLSCGVSGVLWSIWQVFERVAQLFPVVRLLYPRDV
jgi:hypothetical protein